MISKFSVKKPYTVLVGVVLAIVLGVVSFTRMTTDLLPSISLPYVIVMTTYAGASPETVEATVTQPVEAAMATVSNIESISSVSSENYSMVILEFAQSADMNAVSLEIRESLDQIKSYWSDAVGNPIIMKLNPDMLPVMIAAVGVDGMDNAAISTYVEESVVSELESIEGVASVSATGLLEESVNVIIRQEKIDSINEKVFAAIDDRMKEAEEEIANGYQELEDGRNTIEDSRKELANGRKELLEGQKELADGRKELEDGKQELEKGKQELENQQEALNNQLAVQKNYLLSAKAQLEETKTNLATAKQLHDAIQQMEPVVPQIRQQKAELEKLRDGGYTARYVQYMESWANAMKTIMDILAGGTEEVTGTETPANTESTENPDVTETESAGNPNVADEGGIDDSGAADAEELESMEAAEPAGDLENMEAAEPAGDLENMEAAETAGDSEVIETLEESGDTDSTEDAESPGDAGNTGNGDGISGIQNIAAAGEALAAMNEAERNIAALRAEFTGNGALDLLISADPQMAEIINAALALDLWCPAIDISSGSLPDEETVRYMTTTVGTALGAAEMASGEALKMDMFQLPQQYDDLQIALTALTSGLGYDAYVSQVNQVLAAQNITDIDKAINDINSGLIAVEKGQMTAAIEFANGKATISMGEYQLEVAGIQLDTGEEQIKSGLDQLKDAEKQLDDAEAQLKDAEEQLAEGEKQLADAKEDAYEQADMSKILTVDMISNLLTAQNFSMPAGYVTEEGISYMVRLGDKPSRVEELQTLPLMDLHMDGVPVVTLGDVADVFYTDNSADIYANVDGSAGIMLTIQKQTGYSTGEVSDRLEARFGEMMDENEDLSLITLMDQGVYIDLVMDSIINNILFGAALAILILLLFLKDIRPTLVVAFSIPVSLVTAIVCMYFSGVTLNIISLSGLALGIGMLVDNSIVVIENIYRLRGEGYSVREAAIAGASEVAGAIMASTLTTVCVFLPIVFTEGITRQLFVDMGLTIAYSLLASLLIALTVVPAMSSKMLVKTKEQKESRFFGAMVRGYEKLLGGALRVKPLVLVIVLVLLVGSIALAFTNGTAFMPDMDSTQLTVSVVLPEDAAMQETAELTDTVVEEILSIEDVQNVGAMISASSMSMMGMGGGGGSSNASTIYVVTKEEKSMSNEEIAQVILEKTQGLEAEITVDTSSMDMSAMGGSGISIQVRGRELDTLRRIAVEVAAILESVEGTTDVSDGLEDADEELRIIINRDEAVHYGLTVAQVYAQIYPKLASASSATTLAADAKDYNVYVMDGNDIELTRELVKALEVEGTDENGEKVNVPLSEIAVFETTEAFSSINRADQTRYVSVSAAIADGYNVGLVSSVVERKLADYEPPAGYRLVYSGENETINDAMEQVMLMLVLALLFMYLIMVAQFQSLLSPFIIMFTIPLAFTGGFLGLFFTGSEVSVIAMIGFVMLAGIIVNNGIVIIDYMNQLRENGMEKHQAILTAGRTRLRPVLMTALTTILALSTMVFSNDMGSEMAKPMAMVTIGGLVYGTLLTLVVIPCIYDLLIREKKGNTAQEKIQKSNEEREETVPQQRKRKKDRELGKEKEKNIPQRRKQKKGQESDTEKGEALLQTKIEKNRESAEEEQE